MHIPGVAPLKAELTPLYLNDAFTPGKTYGLTRLFNTILRIFRNNIAPEAGNLDDIRGGLVNLLVYANRVLTGIEEGTASELEPLDVMDFIFNEIKECTEGRKVPVYAPYVMILLINDGGASATDGCVEHKVSYIQKKLTPAERHAAGPLPEGPEPSARRTRSASAAQGSSSSSQARASYFPDANAKKPTGWERLLMCIGKDNRKALHSQHKESFEMKAMLNELLPADSRRRLPTAPLSYQRFNQYTYTDWRSTEAFLNMDFDTQPKDDDYVPDPKDEE